MTREGQDRADALGWGRRPNRPKTFARNHTIPQKVTDVSIYDKGPEPRRTPACFYSLGSRGKMQAVTARARERLCQDICLEAGKVSEYPYYSSERVAEVLTQQHVSQRLGS